MYTFSSIVSIAKRNGWNKDMGERKLPLHLPIQVLKNLSLSQPNNPILTIARSYSRDTLLSTLETVMEQVESSRTLTSIRTNRERIKQVEQKKATVSVSGDDKKKEDKQRGNPDSDNQQQRGEGQGSSYKPDESNNPDSSEESIEQWMAREEAKEQANRELKLQDLTRTGRINSKVSDADSKLAERLRSILDKYVGNFDLNAIPLWDGKKLVKRLLSNRTLQEARKEQEGRPSILFMNDISGSCQETSEDITLVANSACLLGTIDADIYSLPFGDYQWAGIRLNTYGDMSDMSYHNGVGLRWAGSNDREAEDYQAKRAASLSDSEFRERIGMPQDTHLPVVHDERAAVYGIYKLAKEMGVTITPQSMTSTTIMPQFLMSTGKDKIFKSLMPKGSEELAALMNYMSALHRPLVMNGPAANAYHNRLNEAVDRIYSTKNGNTLMSSMGVTRDRLMGFPIGGDLDYIKGRILGKGDIGLSPDSMTNALLEGLNADIIVYYTDQDGSVQVKRTLSTLKPHQKLYVLTYASFPNMFTSNGKAVVRSALKTLGHHDSRGVYGRPPVEYQSVPSYAFSPMHAYDVDWLPSWFGDDHWNHDMVSHYMDWANVDNAEQLVIIPNVVDVEGYVAALELISSPERMHLAINGGRSMRAHIDQKFTTSKSKGYNPIGRNE